MLGRPSLRKFLANPCARKAPPPRLVVAERETKAAVRRAAAAAGKAACPSQRDAMAPWRAKLNSHPPDLPPSLALWLHFSLLTSTTSGHQPALLSASLLSPASAVQLLHLHTTRTTSSLRLLRPVARPRFLALLVGRIPWYQTALRPPLTSWGILERHLPVCFLGWCGPGGGNCSYDWRGQGGGTFPLRGRTEPREWKARRRRRRPRRWRGYGWCGAPSATSSYRNCLPTPSTSAADAAPPSKVRFYSFLQAGTRFGLKPCISIAQQSSIPNGFYLGMTDGCKGEI